MCRIVVLTVPVEGHFNPFVPIIEALVERGHEVVCFAGRKFQNRVEKAGATFQPPPEKWDTSIKDTYDVFPELKNKSGLAQVKSYFKHVIFDPAPDLLNILKSQIEDFKPDLLVSDTFLVVGSFITELYRISSVRISLVPLSLPGRNIPPVGLGLLPGRNMVSKLRNKLIQWIFNELLFKDVQKYGNGIRKRVGLPPYDKSIFIKGFESSDLVMHTSIPAFEYPRDEFPENFRFIGPVLTPPSTGYQKPEWWPDIEKNLPVVLINQGTVAKSCDDLILPAIEALKDEKIIILAVPVKQGEIMNLPDNIHVEPYIPFGNILPYVDLLITNGGFGGAQSALAHGIPVIIAGATEDKMEVAARLEFSGAGINLRKQKPTSQDIRKAFRKIMTDPSFKRRAQELQADFAKYNAPILAVQLMEELVEEKKLKREP